MTHIEFSRQMSHAQVLLSQRRFEQAESILERLMATGVEVDDIFRMMAIAKMGLGKYQDAEELCRIMLSRHPDDSYLFYLLANIRATARKFDEALQYMDEAIHLDPANADYHAFKSNLLLQTKEYEHALVAADFGLRLDAENIDALNARASALVGLDRSDEAFETINKSLATDPDNVDTHANMGWGLLHQGRSDEALTHFREALRGNPMNAYARSGMLEAMKARFPVYRYFLRMMLWLGKLKDNNQWMVIIGGFIIYRLLHTLADHFELLQPFLYPVIAILAVFFVSTWIFSPLMHLYLLTNSFGKFTLSSGQKESARLVGLMLLLSLILLVIYVAFIPNEGLLSAAILAFAMMIPLGSMNTPILEGNQKKLRLFALFTVLLAFSDGVWSIAAGTFTSPLILFCIILLIGYQWYANYVFIRE